MLAFPVILSRVGILMMTTLDVVVVGRAGAQELAFYVLGYALIDSLIAVMAGLQLGVPVLTARSLGEGKPLVAAAIWRRGLLFAAAAGVVAALIVQGAPWFYRVTGQDPLIAQGGGSVTALLALALPFFGLFLVSAMFLEALEKPFHATIAVGVANIVNLALSLLLVFGSGPQEALGGFILPEIFGYHVPALGAWGCALATVITAVLLGLGLAAYVRFGLPDKARFGLGVSPGSGAPATMPVSGREQRKLGFAAGVSYGLEAMAFAGMTLLAGLLGVIGLASMGVLFALFALTFMVSFGIATATQVRVGNAWGRRDARAMARAGLVGFGLSLCLSSVVAMAFLAAPAFFVGLMTSDQQVILATLPVMVWMLLALLADGGQTVLNHACRGRGDTWVPTSLHLVSYWCVMLPLAYLLAIHWGGGTSGLYQAILISSLVSLVSMGSRFGVLVRRGLPA